MEVARVSGERLARARQEAGLTQSELARELGLSSGTRVSLWERGAEQPRPRFIPELARLLGVAPLDLLVGDPDEPIISALRLAAGLTRDEVWERAQIAKMTYHRIDRGVGYERRGRGGSDARADAFSDQRLSQPAAGAVRQCAQSSVLDAADRRQDPQSTGAMVLTLVDPLELRIIENIRLLTAADVDLLNVVVGQDLGDC